MSELLKSAISEIDYALVSNKGGKEVREQYLNNAKRFINEAEKEQKIQFNEGQELMLNALKYNFNEDGSTDGALYSTLVDTDEDFLTNEEFFQVLQAFAEWGLSDK